MASVGLVTYLLDRLATQPIDPDAYLTKGERAGKAYALQHLADCHRARPPETVDAHAKRGVASPQTVTTFDLLGVKLYQSPSEVLEAIRKAGGEPSIVFGECASDWISASKASSAGDVLFEMGKSCITSVNARGEHWNIGVGFAEDIPLHPGCMAAVDVSLDQPGRSNSASIEAWNNALFKKYGPREPFVKSWGSRDQGPQISDGSYFETFVLRMTDDDAKKQWEDARSEFIDNAKPVAKPRL